MYFLPVANKPNDVPSFLLSPNTTRAGFTATPGAPVSKNRLLYRTWDDSSQERQRLVYEVQVRAQPQQKPPSRVLNREAS